jgi:hypothetical protein
MAEEDDEQTEDQQVQIEHLKRIVSSMAMELSDLRDKISELAGSKWEGEVAAKATRAHPRW